MSWKELVAGENIKNVLNDFLVFEKSNIISDEKISVKEIAGMIDHTPVSYTHLTLPTSDLV